MRSGFARTLVPILLLVALAACGGGGGTAASPSAPATTSESPTESPTPTPSAELTGPIETVEVTAKDVKFDTDTISVSAGVHVVIEFRNRDTLFPTHNVSFYTDEDASERIFRGDTIIGPDAEITYEFQAPAEPGTYHFRCDLHREAMNGDFVVT